MKIFGGAICGGSFAILVISSMIGSQSLLILRHGKGGTDSCTIDRLRGGVCPTDDAERTSRSSSLPGISHRADCCTETVWQVADTKIEKREIIYRKLLTGWIITGILTNPISFVSN